MQGRAFVGDGKLNLKAVWEDNVIELGENCDKSQEP